MGKRIFIIGLLTNAISLLSCTNSWAANGNENEEKDEAHKHLATSNIHLASKDLLLKEKYESTLSVLKSESDKILTNLLDKKVIYKILEEKDDRKTNQYFCVILFNYKTFTVSVKLEAEKGHHLFKSILSPVNANMLMVKYICRQFKTYDFSRLLLNYEVFENKVNSSKYTFGILAEKTHN